MRVFFTEKQKFNQWWLWLLFFLLGIFSIIAIYKQLILEENFEQNPIFNSILILFFVGFWIVLFSLTIIKLETKINEKGIVIRFFPFVKKKVSWQDIDTIKVVDYGFAIRCFFRRNQTYENVYNINSNKGLAFKLKNGKKFLIGTQKALELKKIIHTHFKNNN